MTLVFRKTTSDYASPFPRRQSDLVAARSAAVLTTHRKWREVNDKDNPPAIVSLTTGDVHE